MKIVAKLTFVALLFSLFLPKDLHADIGPKPEVTFNITYQNKPIPDSEFQAAMLSCFKPRREGVLNLEMLRNENTIPQLQISQVDPSKTCTWEPNSQAWGGDCSKSRCRFGYMPPDEFRLAVYVPSLNKTFISHVALREGYYSSFDANLLGTGTITLRDSSPVWNNAYLRSYIKALIITILLELLVVSILRKKLRLPQKINRSIIIVNIVTLTGFWLIMSNLLHKLNNNAQLQAVFSFEIVIFLAEAYALQYLHQKELSLKRAMILSFMMNLVSALLGIVILIFVNFFIP